MKGIGICLILIFSFAGDLAVAKTRKKKIVAISLKTPQRSGASEKAHIKPLVKQEKNVVEVSFGAQTSEYELEPLDKSLQSNQKQQSAPIPKAEPDKTSLSDDENRNLASSANKVKSTAKPLHQLYQDFQKHIENEVAEDYN